MKQNVNYEIMHDHLMRLDSDEVLDIQNLSDLMAQHRALIEKRYSILKKAYMNDYPTAHWEAKANWKPDNRLVVNFAKYLTDTFNGYFIGIPVKVTSDDESVSEYTNMLIKYNDQEDNDAELSRICSIYGKGYEVYSVDDYGNIEITYLEPIEGFMVYDESYRQKPRYFVNYYRDTDNVLHGEIRDDQYITPFTDKGGLHFIQEEQRLHGFGDIPATEFIENEDRMSVFESAYTLICGYNKALSEKLNDVDAFADAYLKLLGPKLDDEMIKNIRDNRVISFEGDMNENGVDVGFLSKPSADGTQENLLSRLERQIYQVSMVANINDENFGNSSGIAMAYKLQSMSNMAKTKERKFMSGYNRRYKVIFSNPINSMNADDWVLLDYKFTRNVPQNILEEAQIAQALSGIVSQETQLSVLSVVQDVKSEVDKLEEEEKASQTSIIDSTMFNNQSNEDVDE